MYTIFVRSGWEDGNKKDVGCRHQTELQLHEKWQIESPRLCKLASAKVIYE